MTPDRVDEVLGGLAATRVVVVGDLMLDEYVWGEVARVSPDAPVQVVDIRRRSHAIGGAGNVAHNIRAAEGEVAVVGAVGDDAAGAVLLGLLRDAGVDVSGVVTVPGRPTTVKTRVMARGQQIVRLDEEDRSPLAADSKDRILESAAKLSAGSGAVLVSDYAKGVIGGDAVAALRRRTAKARGAAPILVDPKLRDLSAYRGCDLITPNRAEAEAATGLSLAGEESLGEACARIREASGAGHVLITLGERGLALSEPGGTLHRISAQAREVYDVTGAGDTVLAYLGLALASGASAAESAYIANLAAGIAVAKVGTSAVTPKEIAASLAGAAGASAKLVGRAAAVARVEHERALGRSIVFTNGCFDLIHAGHVQLLEKARALGDFLVVGVNSDASVRRLKGPDRPLVSEDDRIRVLAALDAVSLVVVFDEDTPLELIRLLRPAVLAKGGDYEIDAIVGADLVRAGGGRVTTIPLVQGRSTSALLDSIRKGERSGG